MLIALLDTFAQLTAPTHRGEVDPFDTSCNLERAETYLGAVIGARNINCHADLLDGILLKRRVWR